MWPSYCRRHDKRVFESTLSLIWGLWVNGGGDLLPMLDTDHTNLSEPR